MLTNCRHPVHRSQLLEGVVLPVSKEDSVLYALKRCDDGAIVVALFSTSLAGDLEGKFKSYKLFLLLVNKSTLPIAVCRLPRRRVIGGGVKQWNQ